MTVLDPQLRVMQNQSAKTNIARLAAVDEIAVEAVGSKNIATVLVEHSCPVGDLAKAGLVVRTATGDVTTGQVDVKDLDGLAGCAGVTRVEASRPLESELDVSLVESNVGPVHAGPPGLRGAGVIVGIIDSGIDISHPNFLRPDGSTRILAIWDQSLDPANTGGNSPAGFNFGTEYTSADIDDEIADGMQGNFVQHRDSVRANFHGTHVTGIAAGDGSAAGQGQPAGTFVGVAPEADIVVVRNTLGGGRGLGDSANTVDAIKYIFDLASREGKPVVINQSQGDNLGPHDGTSLLEKAIDNMLGARGRAMVKSAGNAASDRIHASGTVPAVGSETVRFAVPNGRGFPVTVDLWYSGSDEFDIVVTDPAGNSTGVVSPGDPMSVDNFLNNRIIIDSDLQVPGNQDNRIFMQIIPLVGNVNPGVWQFRLVGTKVKSGRFDAWIQRGRPTPQFLPPHEAPQRTISTPGTSREIITVGSYITKGAGTGSISSFSSLGPTRDGRDAPTLAAPGERIMSSQPAAQGDLYRLDLGTSMAAPHVTGAIALMLQKDGQLTQAQIKKCLQDNARTTAATGPTPNNAWGAGILDVAAAVRCPGPVVGTLRPPCRPTLVPPCRSVRVPCLTQRPPCRTFRPPCPSLIVPCLTQRPPCPTSRPPCVTQRPPCPTTRVPCRSVQVPCLPETVRPPCVTVRPPCPTERPPCTSVQVPCVPETLEPPCLVPSLRVPCPTLTPVCRVSPGPDAVTDAGWGVAEWDELSGYDPYSEAGDYADFVDEFDEYAPEDWGSTDWDDGSYGSTDEWYGNEGYGD